MPADHSSVDGLQVWNRLWQESPCCQHVPGLSYEDCSELWRQPIFQHSETLLTLLGRSDADNLPCEYVHSCLSACPWQKLDFWETMTITLSVPKNILVSTSACARPFCPVISMNIGNVDEYYLHFMGVETRKPLSYYPPVGQKEKTESCFPAQ